MGIVPKSTASQDAMSQTKRMAGLFAALSLHCAWVCAAMYSLGIMSTQVSFPGMRGGSFSVLYLTSILGYCATCFACAALDQKLTKYAHDRRVILGAALLTCLATLAGIVRLDHSLVAQALEVVAGLLTGVGSAVLALYLGVSLSREEEKVSSSVCLAGVVVGFSLSTLVLQIVPFPVSGILTALIPLMETAFIFSVTPQGETYGLSFNGINASKLKFGAVLFESMAVTGLVLGLLKQVSVQTTIASVSPVASFTLLMTFGILAFVPILHAMWSNRTMRWENLTRYTLPLTAGVALIAALSTSEYEMIFDMYLVLAYFLFEALAWMYGAILAHQYRLSPIFLFGLHRGAVTLFMALGAIATVYLNSFITALPPNGCGFIFILLGLVVLACLSLPKSGDILRNVVKCPAVRLMTIEIDDRLLMQEMQAEAAQTRGEGVPDRPSGAGAQAEPASRPAGSPFEMEGSGAKTSRRFSDKVKKVAALYKLTDRETDILFEWVKGNGTAYIQEKHCISEGTVKTHIRNIYRKLDIHKRSDLMHLIETIDEYE